MLLALPAIAAAQPTPLTVQRVWTQDANGNNKTAFAPGETIQFWVQLNNSYGGALLGAPLTITTPFYNNTKTIDIPNGVSTQTWNATAPSTQNDYTVTARAYDSFYGRYAEGSGNFTVTTTSATPGQASQTTPVPRTASYEGIIHNTTYNKTATLTLTSVVQNQGKITGKFHMRPRLNKPEFGKIDWGKLVKDLQQGKVGTELFYVSVDYKQDAGTMKYKIYNITQDAWFDPSTAAFWGPSATEPNTMRYGISTWWVGIGLLEAATSGKPPRFFNDEWLLYDYSGCK